MNKLTEYTRDWEKNLRIDPSERRRRVGIRIEDGVVVLLVPAGFSAVRLRRIVIENRELIDRMLAAAAGRPAPRPMPTVEHGACFPLLGFDYPLAVDPLSRLAPRLEDGLIKLSGRDDRLPAQLLAFYRRQAADVLSAKVTAAAGLYRIEVGEIKINSAASRWGSCSSDGNLNFSWKLILCPEPLVDYVVAHELAHRFEMNHSPAFWQNVAKLCPRYRVWEKLLRDEGERFRHWNL